MNMRLIRPLQVYLDTSVVNFAISTQGVRKEKEKTECFLDQIKEGKLNGYISEVVLREIRRAPEEKKKELLNIITQIPLVELEITEEVNFLSRRYIESGVIPEKYKDDALHLAIATVNKLDVVVSWNFEHLVKVKTRREVRAINTMIGYFEIDIATPEEVIESERT